MIAIIVDALRAVPRAGRRGRPRSASTAGARCGRSASGRRGRRSSPPPCWPPPARWARRSCSRWSSGSVGLRAQPARRPDLLLRAGAAAGGDDRRQRRGPVGEAVRPDDLRLRGGPPGLQRLPLVRRLVRPPDDCASTRCRPDEPEHATRTRRRKRLRRPPPALRVQRSPRERRTPGAAATGSASLLSWVVGHPLCVIAGGDRRSTCSSKGFSTSASTLFTTHPLPSLDQSAAGRLPGPDHRHVHR